MVYTITLQPYTSKTGVTNSFVVRGEGTRFFKTLLTSLGGKFNTYLTGGAGYIFPADKYSEIANRLLLIKNGQIGPTDQVEATRIGNAAVSYYVYQPAVQQHFYYKKPEGVLEYVVTATEAQNTHAIIDNVYAEYVSDPQFKLHLQITNGNWQARGVTEVHTIEFLNTAQSTASPQFEVILPV